MTMSRPAIDTAAMTRVGGQLGTNPAGVFEDSAGRRYYVKTLESAAHARNEWIAAQLYRLAGAPTLNYVATLAPDQIATEWIALDKKCIAHLDVGERQQAQHWFGVHAWIANWDAAGFHGDNQGVASGRVLTLDVGGALTFRAQGDPKGKAFGTKVDEIESLRRDDGNPHALRLFADMTPVEIATAIQVVTRISDQSIRQTVLKHGGTPNLAEKMIARKADMARRLVDRFSARIDSAS